MVRKAITDELAAHFQARKNREVALGQEFRSTKIFDGFSTCFRQWRATGTHCKFLHGYAVSFKVTFIGKLDDRNWCFDFGGFKRAENTIEGKNPHDWLCWLLDHTVLVAEDDPHLKDFKHLQAVGAMRVRVLPDVGAERFAEYLGNKLNEFVYVETQGRVRVERLEFFENGKNSAIYEPLPVSPLD